MNSVALIEDSPTILVKIDSGTNLTFIAYYLRDYRLLVCCHLILE
jgi:hypothetical protein